MTTNTPNNLSTSPGPTPTAQSTPERSSPVSDDDRRRARLLVVDDHPVVHMGLRSLFEAEPWIDVVAEAFSADAAIIEAERLTPDIAVVDLSLGQVQSTGLHLVREFRERFPDMRVLVLTMHDEALYAGRAMRAGAHGYVTKRDAVRDLIDAIRRVLAGEKYLKSGVKGSANGGLKRTTNEPDLGATVRALSDRELEVYGMIGKGLSTREIAEQLNVSVKTIETHRTRIKAKLGITSTQQLVRNAVQWATLETDQSPT